MFMTRSPADELARLRAQIAELKARETALEAHFLQSTSNSGRYPGFTCDVVVTRTAYQVFDISKLPAEVLDDDRFYATKHVTSIRIEEHDGSEATVIFPKALSKPDPYPAIASR